VTLYCKFTADGETTLAHLGQEYIATPLYLTHSGRLTGF